MIKIDNFFQIHNFMKEKNLNIILKNHTRKNLKVHPNLH